jgi:NitT/TauT family transport system ATP-binding protein
MGTICFTDASKTYPGAAGVRALEGVNFRIGEGEFVALLGPSGCGKSTLLNLVAGFEDLTEGRMTFDDRAVTKPGPDRGVVFQEASLLPWLSVWENVVFGPKVQKLAKADYEPRARDMLRMVGLENFHDALPVQLSGGMRQRVGIARVLVMQPRALLMDEPFGALDAQTRLSMQQLLLEVSQNLKTTVLFVTHDIDEAILLADRVCVMTARPGRITRDIPITLRRPRSIDDLTLAEFTAFKAMIMAEMRGAHRLVHGGAAAGAVRG